MSTKFEINTDYSGLKKAAHIVVLSVKRFNKVNLCCLDELSSKALKINILGSGFVCNLQFALTYSKACGLKW